MTTEIKKNTTDRGNEYTLDGKMHRDTGPARDDYDGTKIWYQHGILHREAGPAIEHSNGANEWYLWGKQHREDGPAVILSEGTKMWYLNDEELSEEDFDKFVFSKKLDDNLEEKRYLAKKKKI